MASVRSQIVDSLIEKLKDIDGTTGYRTKIAAKNVKKGIAFWDAITDYPSIYVAPGHEVREYHPGEFKWAFLLIAIRVFVKEDDPQDRLELLISDIETIIDANNELVFDTSKSTVELRILSIDTDEGLLKPYGAAEIQVQVRYEVP